MPHAVANCHLETMRLFENGEQTRRTALSSIRKRRETDGCTAAGNSRWVGGKGEAEHGTAVDY